jgi:riboflavin synthase
MFTGIIEEIGTIQARKPVGTGTHLTIQASRVLEGVALGDSIAVDGVCLTVVRFSSHDFTVDVVPESMRRTTLQYASPGRKVNLERAMTPSTRFGGHMVSGHVDGMGGIVSIVREGMATVLRIQAPPDVMRYVVEKGSIAIDGISLTVMDADADGFRVSIIPHTGSVTTIGSKKVGDMVNLECDLIGKYVEKMLMQRGILGPPRSRLTDDFLRENGFADGRG